MAANALKKISGKSKKPQKKRATSLATLKLGDEPSFVTEPSTAELTRALNWYNVCADDPEVRKAWVVEFLTRHGWKSDSIKTVANKIKKLVPTHSAVARLFNRNQPLDLRYSAEALGYFEGVLSKQNEDDLDSDGNPIEKVAPAPKQVKNLAMLVRMIEEEIEAIMETGDGTGRAIYTTLQAEGVSANAANQLKRVFAFQTEEFVELAGKKCDPELDEAYSHLFLATRKKLAAFMVQLNADLDSFAKVAKAVRKTRKPKPVKADKLVKRLKYKVKDDEYKIASVSPDKIIGAQWLWVFNTKYRKIAFYQAGEGGFSVKGTTLQNYVASGQKTLRKPEQQLSGFTSGAVKALPKAFDAIKTASSEGNGRINEECILLRVFA
jgi:hypothetical protein